MENAKMYPWEEAYVAAILETDTMKLPERIGAAQGMIRARMDELNMDHGGLPAEQEAISAAIRGLELLERERLVKSE